MLDQFAYDPPWWLLLRGPGIRIEENGIADFLASYVPRMEQFLRALERVETKFSRETLHDHGDGDGFSSLDPATRAEASRLVRIRMEQLTAYKAESATRFPWNRRYEPNFPSRNVKVNYD